MNYLRPSWIIGYAIALLLIAANARQADAQSLGVSPAAPASKVTVKFTALTGASGKIVSRGRELPPVLVPTGARSILSECSLVASAAQGSLQLACRDGANLSSEAGSGTMLPVQPGANGSIAVSLLPPPQPGIHRVLLQAGSETRCFRF